MLNALEVQHLLDCLCFDCYCFKTLTNVLPTSLSALITKFVIIIREGRSVFAVTIDTGTTAPYVSNTVTISCVKERSSVHVSIWFIDSSVVPRRLENYLTGNTSFLFCFALFCFFSINRVSQNTTNRNFISRESVVELYVHLLLMWLELGVVHVCELSLLLLL